MNTLRKIIAGGQAGADRAALDWAIHSGVEHGGWCPQGRKAEDGTVHARYKLEETPDSGYLQRTKWNVRDSDGTVFFSFAAELDAGSQAAYDYALDLGRPCLRLRDAYDRADVGVKLADWVARNRIEVLNVAGSRESEEPKIGDLVFDVLDYAFTQSTGL